MNEILLNLSMECFKIFLGVLMLTIFLVGFFNYLDLKQNKEVKRND